MKIVINKCFGGFHLSDKAIEMIMTRKGFNCFRYAHTKYKHSNGVDMFERRETASGNVLFPIIYYTTKNLGERVDNIPEDVVWDSLDINRSDPDLVAVVEEIGKEANTGVSELAVVEIPEDVDWVIQEYDGLESIHEAHRVWTA